MIVLDTNVISEMMRPQPDVRVMAWLQGLPPTQLATTTINLAEIRYGLARLAPGRRRVELETRFGSFVARGFAERILDFDQPAAGAYAQLAVEREREGRRLEGFDGLIAAIALSRGLPIATRDGDDFAGCGIPIVNPWTTE